MEAQIYNSDLSLYMEDVTDERLIQAVRKSTEEGSNSALLKEELRLKIKTKRCELGEEDIDTSHTETPNYQLTPEELNKRERRKEQNRKAATKFREKRKSCLQAREQEHANLTKKNKALTAKVDELKKIVAIYEKIYKDHCLSGQCSLNVGFSDVTDTPNSPTQDFFAGVNERSVQISTENDCDLQNYYASIQHNVSQNGVDVNNPDYYPPIVPDQACGVIYTDLSVDCNLGHVSDIPTPSPTFDNSLISLFTNQDQIYNQGLPSPVTTNARMEIEHDDDLRNLLPLLPELDEFKF